MQTFLPYADFAQSAASLDQQRLGKQRVEAYQILLQLCGMKMVDYPVWEPRVGKWNHPAMAMWAGHEVQLLEYIRACCNEWTSRGYRDTCLDKSSLVLETARTAEWQEDLPAWIGTEEIHRTHRSNLLRKDINYYSSRFPEDVPEPKSLGLPLEEDDFLEYIWPKTEYELKPRMAENYARIVELYEKLKTEK